MSSAFRALGIRNYLLWVSGALVSNIGTWMQRVPQDWLVLRDDSGTTTLSRPLLSVPGFAAA